MGSYRNFILYFVRAAALSGFFSCSVNAALITIDFEADTDGAKTNAFVPNGVTGVSFSDTVDAGLFMFNFGTQGAGQHSLSVNTDQDGSLLQIDLAMAADFISLDFGNDDPSRTNAGDLAVLTGFLGGSQVGQSTVTLNRDDIMNQSITLGTVGGSLGFDRLTFAYTDPFLSPFTGGGAVPVGSIEIVDNIQINLVPIPAAVYLLLSGLGVLGITAQCRYRNPARLGTQ